MPPVSQAPRWRFLVDQNLPNQLVIQLQADGFVAEHTHPLGLGARLDRDIYLYAQTAGATLITQDHDLERDRDQFPTPHAGIVLVELPQFWPAADVSQRVLAALRGLRGQSLRDRIVLVAPSQVIVRQL
jgi:predicted nuclease of predicted toxin-antitoxin system